MSLLVLIMFSVCANAEPDVWWEGKTESGHHILHVEDNGKHYEFPVDPKDISNPEAIEQVMNDVMRLTESENDNAYKRY